MENFTKGFFLASLFLCSFPAMVTCVLNLRNSEEIERVWCLDIDVLVITSYEFVLIFLTILICHQGASSSLINPNISDDKVMTALKTKGSSKLNQIQFIDSEQSQEGNQLASKTQKLDLNQSESLNYLIQKQTLNSFRENPNKGILEGGLRENHLRQTIDIDEDDGFQKAQQEISLQKMVKGKKNKNQMNLLFKTNSIIQENEEDEQYQQTQSIKDFDQQEESKGDKMFGKLEDGILNFTNRLDESLNKSSGRPKKLFVNEEVQAVFQDKDRREEKGVQSTLAEERIKNQEGDKPLNQDLTQGFKEEKQPISTIANKTESKSSRIRKQSNKGIIKRVKPEQKKEIKQIIEKKPMYVKKMVKDQADSQNVLKSRSDIKSIKEVKEAKNQDNKSEIPQKKLLNQDQSNVFEGKTSEKEVEEVKLNENSELGSLKENKEEEVQSQNVQFQTQEQEEEKQKEIERFEKSYDPPLQTQSSKDNQQIYHSPSKSALPNQKPPTQLEINHAQSPSMQIGNEVLPIHEEKVFEKSSDTVQHKQDGGLAQQNPISLITSQTSMTQKLQNPKTMMLNDEPFKQNIDKGQPQILKEIPKIHPIQYLEQLVSYNMEEQIHSPIFKDKEEVKQIEPTPPTPREQHAFNTQNLSRNDAQQTNQSSIDQYHNFQSFGSPEKEGEKQIQSHREPQRKDSQFKKISKSQLSSERSYEEEMRDQVVERDINKRKILYSDKSESSVEEKMADTPSNYNIPNMRFDEESQGLRKKLYTNIVKRYLYSNDPSMKSMPLTPNSQKGINPHHLNDIDSQNDLGASKENLEERTFQNIQNRLNENEEKMFVKKLKMEQTERIIEGIHYRPENISAMDTIERQGRSSNTGRSKIQSEMGLYNSKQRKSSKSSKFKQY